MTECGDSIRVVHPLFHGEGGGSIPTSPLQLHIERITMAIAVTLNQLWHSRLPKFTYPPEKCIAYAAEYDGLFYATAIWSQPSARRLNHTGRFELKRLAIAPDAPKNTASRMLRIMAKMVKRDKPNTKILISYQDVEVHTGSIYKAAGWSAVNESKVSEKGWNTRSPNDMQSTATKVRWEYQLRHSDIHGEGTR